MYIRWGAHWRQQANTTEPSVCGGNAALCQITSTTCLIEGSIKYQSTRIIVHFNYFSVLFWTVVSGFCRLCRDGGGGHWLVRMEWRPAGWSVCLRLLIFPCAIKSRSSLLAPAHLGGRGKRAVKRLCVPVGIRKLW